MSEKILFIEDEPDQIMMLRMRMKSYGFEIISALDGEEGLNRAFQEKPDLILLDLIMPKMNGLEVCQRLKENSETRSIPIIILTASGGKDVEEKSQAAGADDCIRKPYDSGQLVARIKALIAAKGKGGSNG
jgi:DNA-binding response OmpR family regulator